MQTSFLIDINFGRCLSNFPTVVSGSVGVNANDNYNMINYNIIL